QRLLQTMEHCASPCARHVGCGVGACMMDQAIRQLRGSLVVADAPEDEPAQNEQVDQGCCFRGGAVTFEAIDLGLQIEHSNSSVRQRERAGGGPVGWRGDLGHVDHAAAAFAGVGGARYGKVLDDQAIGPSTPSLIGGPFPPLTYSVKTKSMKS